MSTTSQASEAAPVRHRGIKVAYIFGGSTAAWMAHLFFASSFVQYSCNAHGTGWYQHLATLLCAAVAAHATWVAYGLHREGQRDTEDAGTSFGANNFIGVVGVIVGLANLLLILGEGSFSALIHPGCHL
jgi:4-hydroxybenzoate polyprenyltransferase